MSVIFSFYAVFGRTMERVIARDRLFEHVASPHMTKGQTTFDGQWWREAGGGGGAGGDWTFFPANFFSLCIFCVYNFFFCKKFKKEGWGETRKRKNCRLKNTCLLEF